MGKKLLLLLALLLSMLLSISGCSSKNENRQSQKNRSYEHISFTSSIAANDCLLCSDISDHQLSWYLGQDNLGLVAVNSFDVELIEINRYSADGVLIEEATGCMKMGTIQIGESQASVMLDVDRGYSHINITPSENGINPHAISSFLCQDCLDAFSKQYFEDENPPEVAIINFSTKELRPLTESCTWFTSDSYCVDCRFEDDGKISLRIYYRPVRYHE